MNRIFITLQDFKSGSFLGRWACRPPAAVPSSEEGSAKPPGGHPPANKAGYLKCATAGQDFFYSFGFCFIAGGCPLAVPGEKAPWSVAFLPTAALRFAPYFRHRRREQPHPPANKAGYLKCATAGQDFLFSEFHQQQAGVTFLCQRKKQMK